MTKSSQNLKPIVHRAANELAYEQLREAISSGKYAPGDNLSTRNIADQLGVSQMPVREAFHRLIAEGIMVKRENRTIGLANLTATDFAELTEIRIALEGMAAANAARNANKKLVRNLQVVLDDLEQTVGTSDRERHLALNRDLHFLVYNSSGSRNLLQMIELLWLRVGPLLRHNTLIEETVVQSNICHERLVAAISDGDAEGARDALVQDLRDAAEVVGQSMSMSMSKKSV